MGQGCNNGRTWRFYFPWFTPLCHQQPEACWEWPLHHHDDLWPSNQLSVQTLQRCNRWRASGCQMEKWYLSRWAYRWAATPENPWNGMKFNETSRLESLAKLPDFLMENEESWSPVKLCDGGGGGSRTRVLQSFHSGRYKFSRNLDVFSGGIGNRPPHSGTPP